MSSTSLGLLAAFFLQYSWKRTPRYICLGKKRIGLCFLRIQLWFLHSVGSGWWWWKLFSDIIYSVPIIYLHPSVSKQNQYQGILDRFDFKAILYSNLSRPGVFNKLRRNCSRRQQLWSSSGAYCLTEDIIIVQISKPISSAKYDSTRFLCILLGQAFLCTCICIQKAITRVESSINPECCQPQTPHAKATRMSHIC